MAAPTSTWEETLSKATARGSNGVPGVVLEAITSSGKQLYSKVIGYNGLSPTAPPLTKDATFWIASCTKLLTSISALQCVERGLVSLDEPVEKWLPELSNKPIISLEDNQLTQRASTTKITLRQLLTHTSGLSYQGPSPALTAWREQNPLSPDAQGTVTKAFNTPLIFEPGQGWGYGTGIDWAGILVERLNDNITLGEYFQKHIFAPLGLRGESTTFHLNSPAAQQAKIKERLLSNAHRQQDGSLIEQDCPYAAEVREERGGEGLFASVGDYMSVLQDLIAPEPKLLQKDNLEAWLFAGHVSNEKALHELSSTRTAMTPEESSSIAQGFKPLNYSLGGMFWELEGEILAKGTLTWGGLPNLKWFANREKGVAAMFATQITPYGDEIAQDLSTKYFQEVWRLYKESA